MTHPRGTRLHPTAIVEDGVLLGEGTAVWDGVHLRAGARIGAHCIVGEKTYVAYDVVVGDYVKINAGAYLCSGVTVEDFVMIGAHAVFTNDRYPRAGDDDLSGLRTSAPTADTLRTRVGRGATVGANATIGPGLTLGAFSMIGMGAVVTAGVPPHALVAGNPARQLGWVCICGLRLPRLEGSTGAATSCGRCGRTFTLRDGRPHVQGAGAGGR